MGLFRSILSPENALFQSSPFFVNRNSRPQKSKILTSHQISVTDLKSDILVRIDLKINLVRNPELQT